MEHSTIIDVGIKEEKAFDCIKFGHQESSYLVRIYKSGPGIIIDVIPKETFPQIAFNLTKAQVKYLIKFLRRNI